MDSLAFSFRIPVRQVLSSSFTPGIKSSVRKNNVQIIPLVNKSARITCMSIAPNVTESGITIEDTDSESEAAEKLVQIYKKDPARFDRIVSFVHTLGRSTRPLFPEINVSTISVEDASEHIDESKLNWNSEEGKDRASRAKELQYERWNWAVNNINTYVNMLRASGFSDTRIQAMIDGTPLSFKTEEDYKDLRVGLSKLKHEIEKEMGWGGVGFVITGSSVCGFSQNPLKGKADKPTKLTNENESDVDICVVADGIANSMFQRLEKSDKEPITCFATTCSATTTATRFGSWKPETISESIGKFYKEWDEKLPGGLQLTFAEDDYPIPPWEARIDIQNV